MNLELIRLKKKLSVMDTEGSNQVFMDLLRLSFNLPIEDCISNIQLLELQYKNELKELEKQETKYEQGKLL